jgi:two-component system OmpR family response regulator
MTTGAIPPRVLLVEDHPLTLNALSRLLQLHGYRVDAVATAAAALSAAAGGDHAVVVSDIELPDATGEALMRELRRRHGYTGVAITGHDGAARRRSAAAAGFAEFFLKPVRVDEFLRSVDDAAALHLTKHCRPLHNDVGVAG